MAVKTIMEFEAFQTRNRQTLDNKVEKMQVNDPCKTTKLLFDNERLGPITWFC